MAAVTLKTDSRTHRQKVGALAETMFDREQVECPITHHFAHHVYGREMFIKKDTVVVGAIHKYSQLNVLVSGDLSVATEDGVKRIKPPFVIVSPPGTQRAVYAHEDSIWLVCHGTEETDLEKIEKHFIAKSEREYLEYCETLKIGANECPGA